MSVLKTKGERTRDAILTRAAELATEEGLELLSIGRLAEATEMSKSGLFAHFGSKEELQLATVDHAASLFRE
jgi:AcrR family transcriptional regulator